MSTHMPGFLSFFRFLHHFVLTKLATSGMKGLRQADSHGGRTEDPASPMEIGMV